MTWLRFHNQTSHPIAHRPTPSFSLYLQDDSVANLSLFEWTRPGWWSERKEVATKPEAVTGGGKTYLG